jgi:hypothetical protein
MDSKTFQLDLRGDPAGELFHCPKHFR